MARLGLISVIAGFAGLLASTQAASAESLRDQIGFAGATLVAAGWFGLLLLLAVAIVLPLVRR